MVEPKSYYPEGDIGRRVKLATMATVMATIGSDESLWGPNEPPKEKSGKKCLLFSCSNLTTHNGGYCCADHCKQDRKNKK